MPPVAQSRASLRLLVPVSILPGEGEEPNPAGWNQPATDSSALFSAYRNLATPRAAEFLLTGDDVSFSENIHVDSELRLLKISSEDETGLPQIEVLPATSHFDWAGVLREIGHAMLGIHFIGTPDEVARVFTEGVREVANIAALGFAGDAVPLISMRRTKEGVIAKFLGIWLADEQSASAVRASLPGKAWHDGAGFEQADCILLDAAEVEGRGLKEALASAAMLAMIFSSSAQAADPAHATVRASVFKSLFGGSQQGEKLPVKSQKLMQEHPRIHRDVLDAESCDMRVIVNIGAQRAYIVKDGRIAFDTPISTAATGHRTPRGTFTITEKVRSGKMSTIYKCPLPGWMRLGETAVGMHQGDLPGYPASHGCIRMPIESALFIFDRVKVGTPVEVVDSWSPQPDGAPKAQLVAQSN